MKLIVVTVLFAAIAFEFYQLMPQYPPGLENVTFKRKFFSACFHGLFKVTVWAERFGLIDESADVVQWMLSKRVKEPPPPDGIDVEHMNISDLPVIIFRPVSLRGKINNRAIVYFHGGGFAIGSTLSHYSWTMRLANSTDSVVISVEYPLAPRHPFPAAVNDCIKITKTIFDMAQPLGIDRNRIAVAGDSAGGNLAAVVALDLAFSDEYRLKAQLLLSPVLVAAGVSLLPSYAHYHHLFMIHLDWFIVKYAGVSYTSSVEAAITSEQHVSKEDLSRIERYLNISALPDDILSLIPDRHSAPTRISGASELEMATRPKEVEVVGKLAMTQRAWPLIFEDELQLSRVAPALIQPCEFDPFRDETLLYFNRLRSLGVVVSLSFLPKAIHAEPLVKEISGAPPSEASLKGVRDIVNFINEQL